jgi:hypothetical protein
VEIRLVNERAALSGRLVLGQATLSLARNFASSVCDILTAELGLVAESDLIQPTRLSF